MNRTDILHGGGVMYGVGRAMYDMGGAMYAVGRAMYDVSCGYV